MVRPPTFLRLLTAIALVAVVPVPARANMAQSVFDGEKHGPLVPETSSAVRVDDEKLSFELADDLASAEVRAVYRLTNAGAARESSQVAFAFVRGDRDPRAAPRASIEVDGAPVAAEVTSDVDIEERGLRAFLAAHPEVSRALSTGATPPDPALPQLVAAAGGHCGAASPSCEGLQAYHRDLRGGDPGSPQSRDQHILEAAAEATPAAVEALHRGWSTLPTRSRLGFVLFHLDLAPGQTRAVTVRYTHAPGLDKARRVPATYVYDYLLSPAKRWASFGALEITVRAPGHATVESSLPLRREGEVYRATAAGLPEGELHLTAYSRRGLWLGWTETTPYWTIVLIAAALAMMGAGALTGRFWQALTRWKEVILRVLVAGPLAAAAAVAAMIAVTLPMPDRALGHGYGGAIGIILIGFLAVPVGALASFLAAARGRRAARSDLVA